MYNIGSSISWYSYGHTKSGIVIAIVPTGEVVLESFRPSVLHSSVNIEIESQKDTGYALYSLSKACMNIPRDEESYLVSVRNILYWPKNSILSY